MVAAFGVAIAALIIGPTSSPDPLSSGRTILYAAVLGLIALSLSVWWSDGTEKSGNLLSWRVSRAYLATVGPGLFLIGRVRFSSLVIVLIAGILVAVFGNSVRPAIGLLATTALLLWMSLVGIASLDVSGTLALALAASIAAAGASWVCEARRRVPDAILLGTTAVVGAQLLFALRFQEVSAHVSATLWLVAVATSLLIVIAAGSRMAR